MAAESPPRPPEVRPDAILRILRVPPESEGLRLDRFLVTQLRSTSRTRAQTIIDVSAFSWEGRRLRASERVKAEQKVVLWRPALDEGPLPERLTFLYEDDELLVVDKPALMTVHPTARHHKHTVIKLLEEQRPGEDLALVHRLDRETSGILLVAKSKEADRRFKAGLENQSILEARRTERGEPVQGPSTKSYLAITWGVPQDGLVDAALESDPSPLRVKMSVCAHGGLAARTRFTVLQSTGSYSLVRCDLYTGRQHQIRVHLAHLGTPIVGDKLYGPDEMLLARGADNELTEDDLDVLELPRHALHAAEYRILHPFSGKTIELSSPLPEDLNSFFLRKMRAAQDGR